MSRPRPYVVLSCAMSVDGYIDDASDERLVLSGAADLDRVEEVRAGSDAILVGAGTIRADNPRLLVRSPSRRDARIARGVAPDPMKVTLTNSGDLDPAAQFFTAGESVRLVYVASPALAKARHRIGDRAEVIDAGDPADLAWILADLAGRGVERLMVEGGAAVLTQFLNGELADELRLAITPYFVGDPRAPRFGPDDNLPARAGRAEPARLVNVSEVGGDAVLTYALSNRFIRPSGVH